MLEGRKIILGITGSIAAYKSAYLARLLMQYGAEVRVVMTPSAAEFITPLTFSTLTGKTVYAQLKENDAWSNHVELGLWADLMIIAPCTANTLAKMATGVADNLLMAVYLSARCPVMIAPAMDVDMWHHPATQRNVGIVSHFGNFVLSVGFGKLASGLTGEGRLAEPEEIVSFVQSHFSAKGEAKGIRVLITSGPTREAIDPVRCITNRSSGKMGAAMAKACLTRGAEVTIISGPVSKNMYPQGAKVHWVESASEMLEVTRQNAGEADWVIFAAAVADYRPVETAQNKIKKSAHEIELKMVKNPDISAEISSHRQSGQVLVGFALETENELSNAKQKLHTKNLDCIVMNSLRNTGAGFDEDTNQATLISKDGEEMEIGLSSKEEVANQIVHFLVSKFIRKNA